MLSTVVLSNENQTCRGWEAPTSTGWGGCHEIPPDAIRELIINAMVHRSYLDHGTIQVAVYDNRLEITSPGKLPMGQTMERMKEGYSKIRNEALAPCVCLYEPD